MNSGDNTRLTASRRAANVRVPVPGTSPPRSTAATSASTPVYGARPLKRVIQRELQNPLAQMILEGRIDDGDTVKVTASDSGLVINGEKAVAAAAE